MLVIIGLLVGAVVVGQYLIEVALIGREISAIQGYVSALNTFRIKYNYLPGDLPNATQFFPVTFNGNGNSSIFATNAASATQLNTNAGTYEFMAVNTQLAYAGLINQKTYDETVSANGVQGKMIYETPTKNGLCAVGQGSYNMLRLGCNTGNSYGMNSGTLVLTQALYINAPRAYAVDVKLDDGMPRKGKIQQQYQIGNYWYAGCTNVVSGVYYYNVTNESYETNGAAFGMQGCPLWAYNLY